MVRRPVSVVLIREWPEQLTGSGCCGKVTGDGSVTGSTRAFASSCAVQERFGLLHRAVRQLYPESDAAVVTVDPRNQLYLIGKLGFDVLRTRPGWRQGLRTLCQWFPIPAVVVDGSVLPGGADVTPDALCHAIALRLGDADLTIPA